MNQQEQWRPVVGFPDYKISDQGRVASVKRGGFRILAGGASVSGYRNVLLYQSGVRAMRRVHTLVAEAFHGPRPTGLEIRHLDGDMLNNAASNIRYGTHEENLADQRRHRGRLLIVGEDPVPTKYREGFQPQPRHGECRRGHALGEQNTYHYPDGRGTCRICKSANERESRLRRQLAAANIQTEDAA